MLGIVREDKEDNVAGGMGREEEEMRLESPGDGLCMPLWLQSLPPPPRPFFWVSLEWHCVFPGQPGHPVEPIAEQAIRVTPFLPFLFGYLHPHTCFTCSRKSD